MPIKDELTARAKYKEGDTVYVQHQIPPAEQPQSLHMAEGDGVELHPERESGW